MGRGANTDDKFEATVGVIVKERPELHHFKGKQKKKKKKDPAGLVVPEL